MAPTIKLCGQTSDDLGKALRKMASPRTPDMINSEAKSRTTDWGRTADNVRVEINNTPANMGRVLIITTKTFLEILPDIERPEDWGLILDEAFSPVEFVDYRMGNDVQKGADLFLEFLEVDPRTPTDQATGGQAPQRRRDCCRVLPQRRGSLRPNAALRQVDAE